MAAALSGAIVVCVVPASAQDATWLAAPPNGNYNNNANWSTGAQPGNTDTAFFGAANTTAVTFSANTQVGSWTFDAGATAYNFTTNFLTFNGLGIVINDGSISLSNIGALIFENSSSAGFATINNSSYVGFVGSSTAGNALLFNSGTIDFSNTNGGGALNNVVTAGSISGAGTFNLGANKLNFGVNGLSTTVSGVIADGGNAGGVGASLVKEGFGTVTLSGANTYSGGTTVARGTLSIAAAGNLGTGELIFEGGTLAITAGGVDFARAVTLNAGGGTVQIGAGLSDSISGTISGAGGLTKTGAGTLALTGSGNAYTGTTNVLAGTLSGGGAAFSLSSASNHVLSSGATLDLGGQFQIIGSLTGAGTVTNSGIAAARLTTGNDNSNATFAGIIRDGASALQFEIDGLAGSTTTLTGANTYSGGTIICNCAALQLGNGGTTGSIVGDVVNDGRLIFNRSDSYTFAGVISGAGGVTKAGLGNTSLTGINTYTGATTINAGTLTLSLNGSIATSSLTTVNAGATLGGIGTVGNTFINGGRLAPGNSIGTLNVTGDLAFTTASNYMVEVSTTAADRVNVSGTATLSGATVNASFAPGSYVNRQYTIVNAAGGVIGTFGAQVNSNLPANFNSSLAYDAGNAYLQLTLNYVPPSPDPTPTPVPGFNAFSANQQRVANTLVNYFNRTGGIPLAFGALDAAGLTRVSGETATGSQQATFDAMNMFLGLMTDPLTAGRGDARQGAVPNTDEALNYAAKRRPSDALAAIYRKAPAMASAFEARWNVWAAGFGGAQTTGGNSATGSNTATSRLYGTAVGADYFISPQTMAGFALAGGGSNFNVNGAGSGRSDLFQAGGFVRHTVAAAYVTAAAAYGWQDITTERSFGGGLQARYTANSYSGRIEAGNRFVLPWFGGVALTPYAAGQVTAFELPSYAETANGGTGTFALAYNGKTVTAPRSELGLRSDKSFALNDAILTLRGRAAWAHDTNIDRSAQATFQSLPGASFVVNGASPARNAALTTAAAELNLRNGLSLAATFEGEFSDVTRSYAGKGVVRYAW